MRRKEIPILFQTEMVQAILDDRKTITRRTRGLKLINQNPEDWRVMHMAVSPKGNLCVLFCNQKTGAGITIKSPYGKSGDALWVRESWRTVGGYVKKPDYTVMSPKNFVYKADEDWNGPFKPSIHMPRAACRLLLENTDVRVERLQDISAEDAKAEGIAFYDDEVLGRRYKHYTENNKGYGHPSVDYPSTASTITSFESLWQSINGEGSWNANPWVWRIAFEKVK